MTMAGTVFSRRIISILSAIAFFAVAGCSTQVSPDTLVGVYAVHNHGKTEQFLRIVQKDGRYLLSEKSGDKWGAPINVIPLSQSTLHAYVKQPITFKFTGLGNNRIAVYKMPPGWHFGFFTTKTGYWAETSSGPIELYKM